jgi:hypothetical protein
MTMHEGYMAYMKMVTDNFIKMQSVEKRTKEALGYVPSDDTVWPIGWEPKDGLRWGTDCNVYMKHDKKFIIKHNQMVAASYLRHNTKTYEEYVEFMYTPFHD